jgi:hypothetical protein
MRDELLRDLADELEARGVMPDDAHGAVAAALAIGPEAIARALSRSSAALDRLRAVTATIRRSRSPLPYSDALTLGALVWLVVDGALFLALCREAALEIAPC